MPGNKNIIIGGVIILVIIALVLLNNGDKKENTPSENLTNNAVETTPKTSTGSVAPKPAVSAQTISKDGYYLINYGASGFTPGTLSIARGKSVRFTNNSNNAMRIVTADTNNPATQSINQSKTVGRGGIYDFTFNEAGTFVYMNYNKTVDHGTITVK